MLFHCCVWMDWCVWFEEGKVPVSTVHTVWGFAYALFIGSVFHVENKSFTVCTVWWVGSVDPWGAAFLQADAVCNAESFGMFMLFVLPCSCVCFTFVHKSAWQGSQLSIHHIHCHSYSFSCVCLLCLLLPANQPVTQALNFLPVK
jgi:hypothetical protein